MLSSFHTLLSIDEGEEKMENKLKKIYFIFLSVLLIIHTFITIAYNFPMTPLKEKYEPYINSYIDPLFTQTWTLFAPTPVNTNTKFEVKFTYNDGFKETGWINISDLIHDKSQANYFSSYQFYSSILIQAEGESTKVSQEFIKNDSDSQIKNKIYSKKFINQQTEYIENIIKPEDTEIFF